MTDPGGVDLYIGGVEHAVLHLLYARFWHKVLFDLGLVSSEEPFRKYFSQGMIQAYAYTDARGQYVPAEEVEEVVGGHGAEPTFTWQGQPVNREYGKIGKSLKNVVSPDDMYDAYGADTFRVYEMSMGPLELGRPWETRAVVGSQRFLQRLWRNVIDEATGAVIVTDEAPDAATLTAMHRTIAGVREDFEHLRFNTAIAKLIELNNVLTKLDAAPRAVVEALVVMVAPVAPHIAEELWLRLGHEGGVTFVPFPRGRAVAPRRGDGHLRDPDQGQGARPGRGRGDHRRGRAAVAGSRPGQGGGGDARRGAHRHRPRAQARERGAGLTSRGRCPAA